MLTLEKLRTLHLETASSPNRPSHLSAASGLVREGDRLYVVADDENHLGIFKLNTDEPGELLRLFDGELPEPKKERKKLKADLESIARLPASADFPHGALLALGSGSKPNRDRGALLPLTAEGGIESVRVIDCKPLFDRLRTNFHGLNLEGALVMQGELHLLQRGNKKDRINARIRLSLNPLLAALSRDGVLAADGPLDIQIVDLGQIGDIPLCFSDAAELPDGRLVFSAIAENTDDSYHDGPCAGAAVGVLDREGKVLVLETLESPQKIEGIEASIDGDRIRLLLVTDADDALVPAYLFAGSIARPA